MSKLLINSSNKALVNSQGKAYAVTNVDEVAGTLPMTLNAAAGKVLRMMRYGKCTQASTPTPSSPVDIVCNNGVVGEATHANPEVITIGQQTASVPDLLKVGDYVDEADLISGKVVRRCGVIVFDGTETWAKVSQYNIFYHHDEIIRYNNPVLAGLSSHFVGSAESNANMPNNSVKLTYVSGYDPAHGAISIRHNASANVDAFKAFLAAQYANGTPVVVVYPLAEASTEWATPQTLQTGAGSNTISSTYVDATTRITYKI